MAKNYFSEHGHFWWWHYTRLGAKWGIPIGVIFGLFNWNFGVAIGTWFAICLIGSAYGYYQAGLAARSAEDADIRQAQQQREKAAAALKASEESMLRKLSETRSTYVSVLELVPQAERHLTQAEAEFTEGVFAPFWDQIEFATNNLAAFHQMLGRMKEQAREYRRGITELPYPMPVVEAVIGSLPDHQPASVRLQSLVRRAQANFQFASIYEQRKTNKILVHGFTNLGAAIYSMGSSITTAINDLSQVVEKGLDELVDETRGQNLLLENLAQEHRDFLTKQETSRSSGRTSAGSALWSKLDDQSRMLDNMQRGRKPGDFGFQH